MPNSDLSVFCSFSVCQKPLPGGVSLIFPVVSSSFLLCLFAIWDALDNCREGLIMIEEDESNEEANSFKK